jgi:hypothetical protein
MLMSVILFVVPIYAAVPAPADLTGKWEGAWEVTIKRPKTGGWIHDGFSLEVTSWDGNVFKGTYCWDGTTSGEKAGCSSAEGKMVSPTVIKFSYDANRAATITWDLKKMVTSWNGPGPNGNAGLQSPMKKTTELQTSER